MESRLSMEILPKINYTQECIDITDITEESLMMLNAVRKVTKEEPISKEDLMLIEGMIGVSARDLLMTRRVS